MAQAILAGVFGLVGVIVGGLLAEVREWRRERRSLRAAARLVQREFDQAIWSTYILSTRKTTESPTLAAELTEDAWLEHRARLAEALNGSDWADLAHAAQIRHDLIRYVNERGPDVFLEDPERDAYAILVTTAQRGHDALNAAAGISWRKRRKMKRERQVQFGRTSAYGAD